MEEPLYVLTDLGESLSGLERQRGLADMEQERPGGPSLGLHIRTPGHIYEEQLLQWSGLALCLTHGHTGGGWLLLIALFLQVCLSAHTGKKYQSPASW